MIFDEGFLMYFILARSQNDFYGIVANEISNTAKLFIHFLRNLLCTINTNYQNSDNEICIVIDNWSIHKTTIKFKQRWSAKSTLICNRSTLLF